MYQLNLHPLHVKREEDRPVIQMTERAICKALELQKETPEWQDKILRLYLDGKGCDGFFYGVTFDDAIEGDLQVPVEKEGYTLPLLVDPDTHPFVENVLIDWVDDTRGTGFFVYNPDQRKYRGKFFKRPAWQEKLAAKVASSQEHVPPPLELPIVEA